MKIEERKLAILCNIENTLKELDIATMMLKPGDEGMPADQEENVVTALFNNVGGNADEVMAEYFFMPSDADDEIIYFIGDLYLSEEIETFRMPEISMAVCTLNFMLPIGTISAYDGNLRMRFTGTITADGDIEEQKKVINSLVASGINVANMVANPLLRLAEGSWSLEKVLEGFL